MLDAEVDDGLLDNDTILRPREHYTDTHGATEQLFALCYLLGFSFMPRLHDPKKQSLYKLARETSYGPIDPLFSGAVDVGLVREQWDALVRVAASLKNHTAPAHVVLDRLVASSPSDRFAKALTMLGRIVKTTYLLRYFHDADLRDHVHLQLNRGEARHALAKRLFFANQGTFRSGDYAEIMNKVRTQEGTIRVLEERLEERNLDTARLQAELRARRVARAEVPRNVTELIGWRKQRQLTQIEAARVLGLGPGAIAHAESQGWLGRKVQRALLCFTEEMGALSDSVPATTPTRRLGGG